MCVFSPVRGDILFLKKFWKSKNQSENEHSLLLFFSAPLLLTSTYTLPARWQRCAQPAVLINVSWRNLLHQEPNGWEHPQLCSRLGKGQHKITTGTTHQCLRTTALRFGVIFRKDSIKFYVESDRGKKLTAEKLLKQLDSRTRLKKLSEVKILELSIYYSSALSFGERRGAPPWLSPTCPAFSAVAFLPHLLALLLSSLH